MTVAKDFYERHLKIINGIKFTHRQIDITACLLSGWAHKRIAAHFSIELSTVQSHLDTLSQKLGAGGRSRIITFIEQSGKEKEIRAYYQNFISPIGTDDVFPETDVLHEKTRVLLQYNARKPLKKRVILAAIVLCALCLIGLSITFKGFSTSETKINVTCSDLSLPHTSVLLARRENLQKMDMILNGQGQIKTVILAGIGGSGKTTLACQYAKSQEACVIWEISAETKKNLLSSFTNLANALAKTKEEKEDVRFLQEIRDPVEREKQLLLMVKRLLKSSQNWVLIYNNVEDLQAVKKYFPHDPKIWGRGKVIITTRDASAENYPLFHADYFIRMELLSHQQKYDLFTSIIFPRNNVLKPKIQEETHTFLQAIPSFPLDVSTAAHYIKDANISYNTYLTRIEDHTPKFDKAQREILCEFSDYTDTRYSIITLTLEKLIAQNPHFKDLLLLISLIDSQNIPIELLSKLKTDLVVENLMRYLRKHSFITHEKDISGMKVFSIHSSVHKIFLNYFNHAIHEKNIFIIKTLEKYMERIIETEDLKCMKLIVPHLEKIMTKKTLVGVLDLDNIYNYLGYFYYFLYDSKKAKKIFTQSIIKHNKSFSENSIKIARSSILLGRLLGSSEPGSKGKEMVIKGYSIFKKKYNSKSVEMGWCLIQMGAIHQNLGYYIKSKDYLEKALSIYKAHFGKDHFKIAQCFIYLSTTHRYLGNNHQAIKYLEHALLILRKYYPENHVRISCCLIHLAQVYQNLDQYSKSKEIMQEAFDNYANHFGKDHPRTTWISRIMGNLYIGLGKYKEAKKYLRQAYSLSQQNCKEWYTEAAKVMHTKGKLAFFENRLTHSEVFFQESLNIYTRNNHPSMYISLEALGDLYDKKCQIEKIEENKASLKEKAVDYYQQSIAALKKYFPEHSPHLKRLCAKLKNSSLTVSDPQNIPV